MTPQELKNSILQLAIQGKLVEQRPEEGTAQELYAQIQAEKQRLIKEGKIKKEKPLPEITEEEKPFEIPDGWMWVRLGQLYPILNGDQARIILRSEIYDEPSEKHEYLKNGGNGVRRTMFLGSTVKAILHSKADKVHYVVISILQMVNSMRLNTL